MTRKSTSKNTYKDKFLDPKWQQFRLKVFERDGFTCVRCGDKDSPIHAHHTYYKSYGTDPWDYDLDSVITLCNECHSSEHKYVKSANKLLMESIDKAGLSWSAKAILSTGFDVVKKQVNDDYWAILVLIFADDEIFELAKHKFYNRGQNQKIKELINSGVDAWEKIFLDDYE